MTEPDPATDAIPQWHQRLLWQIRRYASEHQRISRAGPAGYDGTDSDGTAAWRSHLNALEAHREVAEQDALSAGIPAADITDAREAGIRGGAATASLPDPPSITRPDAVKEFYLDMLAVDWWELERMALVDTARRIRLPEGLYGLGDGGDRAVLDRNMRLLHTRVTALAAAAALSEAEGNQIWGDPGPAAWRRYAALTVDTWDDPTLEHTWRSYTIPLTDPAVPPYIPVDAATGTPTGQLHTLPPTPDELLSWTHHALTTTPYDTTQPPHPQAQTAVDVALPAADRNWTPEPSPNASADPPTTSGHTAGPAGTEP
ncbi:hypothetical protein [Nocardia blacklockiae]|uniref:hypothetical protein n=1 Tax=Nocardia blacklockiae TaxID=480036 RepID=UPI0018934F5E|nr:hypothetical protein [Nocardia blacklockiae]MBF6176038.1 hypothetical protein [Nocardia blacklockiae]